MKRIFPYLLLLLAAFTSYAQLPDSVLQKMQSMDTAILIKGHLEAVVLLQDTKDSVYKQHLKDALWLARLTNNKRQMSKVYNQIGVDAYYQNDFHSALSYMDSAALAAMELGDSAQVARNWNNIGSVYYVIGNYNKSLEFYLKSLRYSEILQSPDLIMAYMNIGMLYREIKSDSLAYYYLTHGYDLGIEANDTSILVKTLNNLGILERRKGDFTAAIEHYMKGMRLARKAGMTEDLADMYSNLGNVYFEVENYRKANEYHLKALELTKEIGKEHGLASAYVKLGSISIKLKEYGQAGKYLQEGEVLARKYDNYQMLEGIYEEWANLYTAQGKHKEALEALYEMLVYKDSAEALQNSEQIKDLQMQFSLEMQARSDSIREAEQARIHLLQMDQKNQEIRIQQFLTWGGGLLALLAVVTALVSFRAYRHKQKANLLISTQKEEVEHQKVLVEEKNKEITDSITYARRIQEAILPADRMVKEYLKDSFVLYKPKDIVAGDFYWMESVSPLSGGDLGVGEPLPDPPQGGNKTLPNPPKGGNTILFAAADCTGHGVPGAMVSVVCHNALNRAVREFNLTDPGKILDKVRELVIETFEKSDHEVKDGMDIALCRLEVSGNSPQLQYAGANNPLWIITKENRTDLGDGFGLTPDTCRLYEVKPDKQPIGKYAEDKPFTTHTIQLQQGDSFYIFTDGYPDQFGGPRGKKFKYKPFKQLLLDGLSKPMEEQRTTISESFEQWRGDLEQVDDVCVIGVKI